MIPQLLLEEILCGEKNEKDFYTKYGKEELQAALAELRKSNEEILRTDAGDRHAAEHGRGLHEEGRDEAC